MRFRIDNPIAKAYLQAHLCLPFSSTLRNLNSVNPESPFLERAGVNPAEAYASVAGPLHDYGSYITSCTCAFRFFKATRSEVRRAGTRRCVCSDSKSIRLSLPGLPRYIQQFSVYKDELTLYVAPSAVVPTLTFLRDHAQTQFKACMDISGADYPTRSQRFEVVYHLLSVRYNARIRVKTYADEVTPVPSATGVFRSADW